MKIAVDMKFIKFLTTLTDFAMSWWYMLAIFFFEYMKHKVVTKWKSLTDYTMIVVNPRHLRLKIAIFRVSFGIFSKMVSVTLYHHDTVRWCSTAESYRSREVGLHRKVPLGFSGIKCSTITEILWPNELKDLDCTIAQKSLIWEADEGAFSKKKSFIAAICRFAIKNQIS